MSKDIYSLKVEQIYKGNKLLLDNNHCTKNVYI